PFVLSAAGGAIAIVLSIAGFLGIVEMEATVSTSIIGHFYVDPLVLMLGIVTLVDGIMILVLSIIYYIGSYRGNPFALAIIVLSIISIYSLSTIASLIGGVLILRMRAPEIINNRLAREASETPDPKSLKS
ncbi:MAG: hypothetical protein NTX81_01810, partial [Candidatus Bathyarchaeota archaeon]|nr:hypothetical protein [Candidatus Bathyarchaeota archaeon]